MITCKYQMKAFLYLVANATKEERDMMISLINNSDTLKKDEYVTGKSTIKRNK